MGSPTLSTITQLVMKYIKELLIKSSILLQKSCSPLHVKTHESKEKYVLVSIKICYKYYT